MNIGEEIFGKSSLENVEFPVNSSAKRRFFATWDLVDEFESIKIEMRKRVMSALVKK